MRLHLCIVVLCACDASVVSDDGGSDAPSSDVTSEQANACPKCTSTPTYDEALAAACSSNQADASWPNVCVSKSACNSGMWIVEAPSGIDTGNVRIFDPVTKLLVEDGHYAGNGDVKCTCSASGGVAIQCTALAIGPACNTAADPCDAGGGGGG